MFVHISEIFKTIIQSQVFNDKKSIDVLKSKLINHYLKDWIEILILKLFNVEKLLQ